MTAPGRLLPLTAALVGVALLTACASASAPGSAAPAMDIPAAWKEAASAPAGAASGAAAASPAVTWQPATPGDATTRGDWWRLLGDSGLDALAPRVAEANPTVAAAAAVYAQARAAVAETRASLWPTATAGLGATRSGGRSSSQTRRYDGSVQASWAPDLFGRIAGAVNAAQAGAEASAADLAAARLAAEGELASNYVLLREADAEIVLLEQTLAGYRRSYTIARNRYDAGVAARTDVLQAETQLASTEADLVSRRADRARYEHAIAVLIGLAPAAFNLPPATWQQTVPTVPAGVPSTLLQRRPDIAAAERDVAAADANLGVARAAWFPSFSLTGSVGSGGTHLADVAKASTLVWSLGLSLAQTILDGGARSARIDAAIAARDAAVARYRASVLAAFQSVEDLLANDRALAEQVRLRRQASQAADLAEQQMENRYRAGQVDYTDVVTAQVQALSARRSLVQTIVSRQTNVIGLVQALGGPLADTAAASAPVGKTP